VILFLTYHKVSAPGDRADEDFYTVPCDVMLAQIQSTAAAGFQPLPINRLLTDAKAPSFPGANYVLSYDDGTLDHYDVVLPALQEAGLRGIFFVPTAKLNKPGHLTNSQVQEIARAGHTIGFHSHEHRRLDRTGDDMLREQFKRSRGILGDLIGETPWLFAPPGGFINEHVREVALGFGVKTIRTMRWGFNHKPDMTYLETVPLNRHTNSNKFANILQGKQPHLLYIGKQAAKAIVPLRAYERIRSWIFNIGRNN
jgi:peptidoglycan/xylan/chitin deacetylase (PgdA/CDA1 family)